MTGRRALLLPLSVVLADCALGWAVFQCFAVMQGESGARLPLWWCMLWCSALLLLNLLFRRRGSSFNLVLLCDLVLAAAFAALTLLCVVSFSRPAMAVFAVLVLLTLSGRAVYGAFRPAGLSSQMVETDVMLFALLWLSLTGVTAGRTDVVCCALAAALSLAALVLRRLEHGGSGPVLSAAPAMSMLTVLLALALVLLAVFVLLRLSGSAVLPLAAAALSAVKAFFSALWHAFDAFVRWLVSLMGKESMSPLPAETASSSPVTVYNGSWLEIPPWLLPLLGVLAGCALLFLLFALLRRSRGRRLQKPSLSVPDAGRRERRERKKGVLRRALLALWEDLRLHALGFSLRGTPEGVLYCLERRARRRGCPRRPGESPRAFLSRLDTPADLRALCDCLDRRYYSSSASSTLSPAACRALRRAAVLPRRAG